jgi:methylthioribulose-1-phosphate dehydratase
MTRSGREKGALTAADLMLAQREAPAPPGASAEAPLHLALYRDQAEIGCVLHVHSRAAAVLSRRCLPERAVRLQGWELQKALAGQHNPEDTVVIPVFENVQETAALATTVAVRLAKSPRVPAYLLAGHGLYAWGRDLAEARRHVITLDVLLQSELDLRSLR